MTPKKWYKEIEAGTRYTKLVVRKFTGFNYRRNAMFECECDCGTVKEIPGSLLRSGDVKSCGCLPAERMKLLSSSLAEDESGKRYGKLLVVKRLCVEKPNGSFMYECQCDCGKIVKIASHNLRNGTRTNCGAWACFEEMELTNETQSHVAELKNAYFSGHFDGEGCVSFQRDAKGAFPGLTIRVSNVYKPTILEYQEYFGGTVRCIVQPAGRKGRLQWGWHLGAQSEVLRFINRVLPYSKEKKPQLELAKEYLMERINGSKYYGGPALKAKLPELVKRMQDLKQFEYKN
jgi:hypothetical protein